MKPKSYTSTPLFNVLMFSAFWAAQIFVSKLGFNRGALPLPFQAALYITIIITIAVLVLPRSGPEFADLFKNDKPLFWKLFLANAVQSGLGTCLSIIGISLTETINAGSLVKFSTVTTILFARMILKENSPPKKSR